MPFVPTGTLGVLTERDVPDAFVNAPLTALATVREEISTSEGKSAGDNGQQQVAQGELPPDECSVPLASTSLQFRTIPPMPGWAPVMDALFN
jgi:hypothetical protein